MSQEEQTTSETPTDFSFLNLLCLSHLVKVNKATLQGWHENRVRIYVKKLDGALYIVGTQQMVAIRLHIYMQNDFYFSPKFFQEIHFHKFAFNWAEWRKLAVLRSNSHLYLLSVDYL